MSSHTSPYKRPVDDAFPARAIIKMRSAGLGNLYGEMQVWLRDNLGADRVAHQPTRGNYYKATAYYFRTLEDAERFLDAFPVLELADGVLGKPVNR